MSKLEIPMKNMNLLAHLSVYLRMGGHSTARKVCFVTQQTKPTHGEESVRNRVAKLGSNATEYGSLHFNKSRISCATAVFEDNLNVPKVTVLANSKIKLE